MINKGEAKLKVELNKDTFYPREAINLSVTIDNQRCESPCSLFKCRLLRIIDVYKPNTTKVI